MNASNLDGANLIPSAMNTELRTHALKCLTECIPERKIAAVAALSEAWRAEQIVVAPTGSLVAECPIPGRPRYPELVPPLEVRHRSMRTVEGRAALIHALAHIEFNAINLALDALWRFSGMPLAYYSDWLQVAAEEALHFSMLSRHLQTLGFVYGDFPAHNSLWDMAEKTADDVLARIALVPRTLEARGLDASPAVRAKLAQAGDHDAAVILDVILRDEIGHVATGNRWYAWLCVERRLEPVATFRRLCRQYNAPPMRGPFNIAARRAAGFSDAELAALVSEGTSSGADVKAALSSC